MNMIWHWPQFVLTFWVAAELGLVLGRNGEPRKGNHNFWVQAINWAGFIALLYYGGFWGGATP